jgi:cytochrome P450
MELSYVVVASLAVDVWQALPAEKDVTRHLHRTLTGDNALTMLGIPAPAHESLEHRRLRFLCL